MSLEILVSASRFDGHREGADLGGNVRIFRGDRVAIAELDVLGHYARPFGARAQNQLRFPTMWAV